MENRKTIFDYLGQIFCTFGITVTILCMLCIIFGEDAKNFTTMFRLGSIGLSVSTLMQFLAVSILVTVVRFVFFTDVIFKNMSIALRTSGMLIAIVGIISVFIFVYKWFPVDMWQPWVLFFLCFGICFIISTVIALWKEKMENKMMEEALKKLKMDKK